VDALEPEHEVGSRQILALQRPRAVPGDVHLQPFGGDERLSERADRSEVVEPVGVKVERQAASERANQALRQRASKAVSGADQVEAEDAVKCRDGYPASRA
jgi:hypothetical protein